VQKNQEQSDILQAIPVNVEDARDKASKDMNILAMFCLYDVMKFPFPPMFIAMWALCLEALFKERDFTKIALGIPRGFAKTTFVKLLGVFIILFTRKHFILVVSYGEDHAISVINDICKMLSSPNIKALFGDWETNKEKDQQHLKIFKFRGRTVILKAVGASGGIRGLNEEHHRPDVIICEDYQKKKESENEDVSKKLYQELIGTVLKAKSPFGCLYLYVANMYPTPGSILKKLKLNPDWTKLIVGGILADGTSLWEDLHPIDQLIAEYLGDLQADCPEVFLSEVLNDETAGIKSGIDITKLPKCPLDPDDLPAGRAIVIDPAGDNAGADYNGIGQVANYDGVGCLEKVKLGKWSPLQLIKEALLMAMDSGARLICVEAVAYQASLLFWFNKVCEDNGIIGFHFMPLAIGGGSKNAKIITALRKWQGMKQDDGITWKSELHVKDEVRPYIINEIIKFNPMKKNNQDTTLDLLSFVDKVIEQHGPLMLMPLEAQMVANSEKTKPRELVETCSF
jgi:hypothetical protein